MRAQVKTILAVLTLLAAGPALAQQGVQPGTAGRPVQTPQAGQVGQQIGQPTRAGQAVQPGQRIGQPGLTGQTILPPRTGQTTLPGQQTLLPGPTGPIGPTALPPQTGQRVPPGRQTRLVSDAQPGSVVPLFQGPDVRRMLNINDQQLGRLNESFNTLQGRFRNDLGQLNQLNEQQRAVALQELQRNFNAQLMQSTSGILNEQQMNRLRQLDLLRRGPDALNDTNVQFVPNLTAGQRGLSPLGAGTGRQEVGLGPEQTLQRFNAFQRSLQERANAIFIDAQRRSLQPLTGSSPVGVPDVPRP